MDHYNYEYNPIMIYIIYIYRVPKHHQQNSSNLKHLSTVFSIVY